MAWGGKIVTKLQKVLVVQKQAIRALKELEPLASYREAFKDLGVMIVSRGSTSPQKRDNPLCHKIWLNRTGNQH